MRKELCFSLNRLVTVANLFESLEEAFGDGQALLLPEPLGYSRFTRDSLTYSECSLFTNLACEALIRELDMKKGERVLLLLPGNVELMLLAVAVIKAGGIAVPLDHRLPAAEIRDSAEGCGAELAIIDGGILGKRPELAVSVPSEGRMIVAGPCEEVPAGFLSLDEAMRNSSGFFIPYTLKPSSVVGLFHSQGRDGSPLAVMATNRGLLGNRWMTSFMLPGGVDGTCVCALPLTTLGGFTCAVLGMCMGMKVYLLRDGGAEDALKALRESRASAFMGNARIFHDMVQAAETARDLASLRFWLSSGGVRSEQVSALRRFGGLRLGPFRFRSIFAEIFSAGESTTAIALKISLPGLDWREHRPGIVFPPNRVRVIDEHGHQVKRGGEGTLAVKGPSVTPGYWNRLEFTFENLHKGWLNTAVSARRGQVLAVSEIDDPRRNEYE
jgi:long-chain acyl-CoA synthetase